jgi:hypothetical protein
VAASAATAAPSHHGRQGGTAASVVTSVNGVSTAGTCGVAEATGTFTVVGRRLQIVTVTVTSTTTFSDAADTSPSFADVCVGAHLRIMGGGSGGAVSAATITVLPPAQVVARGVVTSVNGAAASGSCGSSGASGSYTFVGSRLLIITVQVTSATTFADAADTSPSFADVCVGAQVKTTGTWSSGTFTASSVLVKAPQAMKADGLVTSVNGATASGSCGSSATAGTFTIVARRHGTAVTIDVATTTSFADPADPTPSFADVCVGNRTRAVGTSASGTLDATSVAVLPPNLGRDHGVVTSVNGVSTAGTCGASAATGAFTLVGSWRRGIVTVDVTSSTSFTDAADPSPSFADVCVGSNVAAFGTFSSKTVTADAVSLLASHSGHHHGRGRRH